MKVNLKIEDSLLKDIDIEDFICEICEEATGDLVLFGGKELSIDEPLFFDGDRLSGKDREIIIKEKICDDIEKNPHYVCYQMEIHEGEDEFITLTLIEG
ncbi:MAG: hypothetical protein ACTTKY_00155 [Catonella sp.]